MARNHATYLVDFKRHLIKVKIEDGVDKAALIHLLYFRQAYPWGRCVKIGTDASGFGLKVGDMLLAPTDVLTDIHGLETMDTPTTICFFRPLRDSGLVGSSVLWDVPDVHSLGIRHFTSDAFPEDHLHNGALGYEGRYIATVFHRCINANVYAFPESSKEDRAPKTIQQIRSELKSFYLAERTINPLEEKLSEVKK